LCLAARLQTSPVLHSARCLPSPPTSRDENAEQGFFIGGGMKEQWKPIPGYEGQYEVSDQGRARSLDRFVTRSNTDTRKPYLVRGKILAQFTTPSGHVTVHIAKKWLYIHRLVLSVFVCPPEQYALRARVEARHLDGDPANNSLQNLAWGTVKENRADRRRLGEKAKLTKGQMLALQADLQNGMLLKDVAVKYGVDRHTAARYRDGYMYA
jgi:hypothetical protein